MSSCELMQRRREFPEETILEEPKKDKTGWFLFIGLVISLIGYVVYDYHINTYKITQTGRRILLSTEYPYQFGGLLLIVFGLIVISTGAMLILRSRIR